MKRLATIGAALFLAVGPAAAQDSDPDRIALLIGNAEYKNAPDAETAERDVRSVAEALRDAGWTVTALTDLDRAEMHAAFARFAARSDEAEDVLIYYSGHALRTGGATYLAPTDQEAESLVDVLFGAVPLELALRIAAAADGQGVLLIDGAQLAGFEPTAFVEPGLARIEAAENVFVVSAAPPGQAIRRSPERDSRFAQALVEQFLQPGADLVETAAEVGSPIWVVGEADAGFAIAPEPEPITEAGGDALEREIEIAYWRTAERTGRAEDYRAYLERYPDGAFAEFARDRLDLAEDEPVPDEPRVDADLAAENAMNLGRGRVRQIQGWLQALGFDPGSVDGLLGGNTRSAMRDWERANDREVNGYISPAELDLLQQKGEAALAEQERQEERQRRIAEAEDNGFWAATGAEGTAAGYRAYLEKFPEGLHSEAARAALQAVAEADADESLRRERRAFRQARRADTAEAWRDYLAEYPNGAFRDEAVARLDAIEGAESEAAELERAERVEAGLGLNSRDRLSIEQRLRSLGFGPGPLDGAFDRQTRAAITNYQASRGLGQTGFLDRQTLVGIVQETSTAGVGEPGQIVIDGTQVIRSLLGAFGEAIRKQ